MIQFFGIMIFFFTEFFFTKKDAVLFSKRCGAFSQKIRCFCSKDAVLFIKRCGAFFRPVNTGLLKVSKNTRLIQFPFELLDAQAESYLRFLSGFVLPQNMALRLFLLIF